MQTVTPRQLGKLLLNVALTRPVFIWGPPGIGKSALVEQFACDVALHCVSLLGSQLAPEDLIGVPRDHCFLLPRKSDPEAYRPPLRTSAPVFHVLKEERYE